MRLLILLFIFVSCEGGSGSATSSSEDSPTETISSSNVSEEFYGVYKSECHANTATYGDNNPDFGHDDADYRRVELHLTETGAKMVVRVYELNDDPSPESDCRDETTNSWYIYKISYDIEFEKYTQASTDYIRVDINKTYLDITAANSGLGGTTCGYTTEDLKNTGEIELTNESCVHPINLNGESITFEITNLDDNSMDLAGS